MMRRAGIKKIVVGAIPLLACLAIAVVAQAAAGAGTGSSDVAVTEPPGQAVATGVAYSDLLPLGDTHLLAVANTFRRRPSYFSVAKLTTTGKLVRSFGEDGYTAPLHLGRGSAEKQARAWAVARQGSRILVAGEQETELRGLAPLIVAYQADGRIDRSFAGNGMIAPKPKVEDGGGQFFDIAVRSDGEIIAVGSIDGEAGPRPSALVAAYHPDGSIDRSFGTNGRIVIPEPRANSYTGFSKVVVRPGGKVLAAGYLHGSLALLRLDTDGRPDPTFGGGDGLVEPSAGHKGICCTEFALLSTMKGGRILLGGATEQVGRSPLTLFRLNGDGSADGSFGNAGAAPFAPSRKSTKFFTPYAMSVQASGRIVVAGDEEEVGAERRFYHAPTVLRYLADGQIDRRFGSAGVEVLGRGEGRGGLSTAATTTPGGRTFVAGATYEIASKERPLTPFLETVMIR